MDALERLETDVQKMSDVITNEAAEFQAAVAEARAIAAASAESAISDRLNALADKIEGSTTRITEIVPNAAPAPDPAPSEDPV